VVFGFDGNSLCELVTSEIKYLISDYSSSHLEPIKAG
jgi:hypothetical protein